MPPNFADLYKPVKDLLTKKFNGDSHKIDLKAKDSVTFNPVFTRNAAGLVSATAAVEGNYEPCDWCLLKLKYTISSSGSLKTNVKAEKMAKGLTIEGNWDAALGEAVAKDAFDLTAKYSASKFNYEGKLARVKGTITDESSVVFAATPELNLGALVTFNVQNKTQETVSLGAAYTVSPKTTIAAIISRDKKADGIVDTLKAGFVKKDSPFTFGGEYSTSLADPKKGVITAACEKALEGGQIVKAKIDTKGGLGFSFQHDLAKQIKLCTSVELAATKDATWASKFGTEIIYEA